MDQKGLENVKSLVEKYMRLFALNVLLFLARLGINVHLEIESLRDGFVSSDTFVATIYKIFDKADVDGNGLLDASEFYCAVLLTYNKLNSFAFGGKTKLPKRKHIMSMFYKYIRMQKAAEKMIANEQEKIRQNSDLNPGFLVDFNQAYLKLKRYFVQVEEGEVGEMVDTSPRNKDEEPSAYFNDKEESTYLVRTKSVKDTNFHEKEVMFFSAACLVCNEVIVLVLLLMVKILFSSNFFSTVFFYGLLRVFSCVCVVSITPLIREKVKEKLNSSSSPWISKRNILQVKKHRSFSSKKHVISTNLETDDLNECDVVPFRKQTSFLSRKDTLRKEKFIIENVKGYHMKRETFVYMAQKTFEGLVLAETYRIFIKMILLPFVSVQLFHFVDSCLQSQLLVEGFEYFVQALDSTLPFHLPLHVFGRDTLLSLLLGTLVALSRFVVDPVVHFIMYKEAEETVDLDMDLGLNKSSSLPFLGRGNSQNDIVKVLNQDPDAPKVWLREEMSVSGSERLRTKEKKEKKKVKRSIKAQREIRKIVGFEREEIRSRLHRSGAFAAEKDL
eukprot:snap_masked-scaffold_42-processed-gene-0.3-mRNA-1 protein AED:1.00 eAED:1.00 QI:0/-1/0/0/-1/1/1/0/556